MKKRIKTGDLVYVPSEVLLFKEDKVVNDWTKTVQPIDLLVTDINIETFEVFYKGTYWLVNKQEVYNT
tara:strand:+ start:127 stop:330 length:204 start_codon:yes stop_codon:yes gene_type:complete